MPATKRSTAIRQSEIAKAAMEITAARGMKGLCVAEVARRVGLVTSGIYRHYRSKDELIDTVLDYIQSRLASNARTAARMAGDAPTRLHALLTKHVNLIRENESIPQVVFCQEVYAGHPRRRTKLLGIIQGYLSEVANIVQEGQNEGSLRRDVVPATVALMFLGLIQPPAIIWHLSARSFDVKEQAEAAWPIFLEGIRS